MKKIFIIALVCSLFLVGCGSKKTTSGEGGSSNNTNDTQTQATGIVVEQKALEYKDGISYINFTVTNLSEQKQYVNRIEIVFTIDGQEKKLISNISDTLYQNDVLELTNSARYDLTSVAIEYRVIK